jgi:hypothetical protein
MAWWMIFKDLFDAGAKAGADVAKDAIDKQVVQQKAVLDATLRELHVRTEPMTLEEINALADKLAAGGNSGA